MAEVNGDTAPFETAAVEAAPVEARAVEEASVEFLGRWNRLVSTTNWEKGRIIFQWRAALIEAGVPAADYSDDAWSVRVGGVTGQHVGRLRRVFERFDDVREQYPRLFWSHFQAALDWTDAEMWLEGAVQSDWSVAEMRRNRAQTLGQLENELAAEDGAVAVVDEDGDQEPAPAVSDRLDDDYAERTRQNRQTGASEGGSEDVDADGESADDYAYAEYETQAPENSSGDSSPSAPFRPFANLADLPDDLHDALEAMKLAIVRHKLAQWADVSRGDVLAALDALRELAMAETE